MRKARLALLSLGLCSVACAREDRSELAADSVRVSDSIRTADSLSAATTGAGVPELRTTTAGARLAPRTERVVQVSEQVPGLLAQAKIHPLDAQHLAQTKFPQGRVESGEILRRPEGLVYSFVIQQPGVSGSEEVLVHAMDGGILTSIHRDAKPAAKPPRE